jgi:hypothetical protein
VPPASIASTRATGRSAVLIHRPSQKVTQASTLCEQVCGKPAAAVRRSYW